MPEGKYEEKRSPSLLPGRGGLVAVVVLNTPVATDAVDIWGEEKRKRGFRGGSTATRQTKRQQIAQTLLIPLNGEV